MKRTFWVLGLIIWLTACAQPAATTSLVTQMPAPASITSTVAATARPSPIPSVTNLPSTAVPTEPSTPTIAPSTTDLPTVVEPTAENTAIATEQASTVPSTAMLLDTAVPSDPTLFNTLVPSDTTQSDPAESTATETPTAEPQLPSTSVRTGLNPQAQTAALLPDFADDLNRADEWNRYTINATIDTKARTLSGQEQVEYTNRDSVALSEIYFHLFPNLRDFAGTLTVSNLSVDGQAREVAYEGQRYLLRVDLPQPLEPGTTTVIAFTFSAKAPINAGSSYYGAFNEQRGVLALASSYPIVAIVRDGTWDTMRPDPQGDFVNSETALYDVTLTAPADWALATTGTIINQQSVGDQQSAQIVSGPQREFTITATQLQHASTDVDGTTITAYYRAEHAKGGQVALQSAANAVQVFNQRYGHYPLNELDIVEITGNSFLGVEYPGLIMIEQGQYTSPSSLEITVAHEVAHQWWYSIVGNNVLTESWLDEAMASYSQIIYQEAIHGPAAAENELNSFRERYRRAITLGRDAPVDRPNNSFRGNYVLLVYGKAVLFFQAMRNQIGEEAFDRFLHTHYEQHRYHYTNGDDLLADAESACSCDLHPLYQSWIEGVGGVDIP